MVDPNQILGYIEVKPGCSLPLQATEAYRVPLPSLFHPIERIQRIQACADEFVTHGALDKVPRVFTRAGLGRLATINAWQTATRKFDESAATWDRVTATFDEVTRTFEYLKNQGE